MVTYGKNVREGPRHNIIKILKPHEVEVDAPDGRSAPLRDTGTGELGVVWFAEFQ